MKLCNSLIFLPAVFFFFVRVCAVVLTSYLRNAYAKSVPLGQAGLHLEVLYHPEHLVALEVPIKMWNARVKNPVCCSNKWSS